MNRNREKWQIEVAALVASFIVFYFSANAATKTAVFSPSGKASASTRLSTTIKHKNGIKKLVRPESWQIEKGKGIKSAIASGDSKKICRKLWAKRITVITIAVLFACISVMVVRNLVEKALSKCMKALSESLLGTFLRGPDVEYSGKWSRESISLSAFHPSKNITIKTHNPLAPLWNNVETSDFMSYHEVAKTSNNTVATLDRYIESTPGGEIKDNIFIEEVGINEKGNVYKKSENIEYKYGNGGDKEAIPEEVREPSLLSSGSADHKRGNFDRGDNNASNETTKVEETPPLP